MSPRISSVTSCNHLFLVSVCSCVCCILFPFNPVPSSVSLFGLLPDISYFLCTRFRISPYMYSLLILYYLFFMICLLSIVVDVTFFDLHNFFLFIHSPHSCIMWDLCCFSNEQAIWALLRLSFPAVILCCK